MKYWIKNGSILLWNGNDFVVKEQDLFINGNKIEFIGKKNSDNTALSDYQVINAKSHLIMPGFVNSHTHVYMTFLKNSADDLPFDKWLYKKILPIEASLSKTDFYWSTMLGCMEMIRSGTTCYLDMHICENECARAAKDSGMRAFLGKCLVGNDLQGDCADSFMRAIKEQTDYESDLVKFVLSPHSVYLCSEELISQIAYEARKRGMLKHIHLSETDKEVLDCLNKTGKTPVEILADLGFLDNKTIAAHCVKVTDKDIEILKEKSVSVVTNPSSNAKLGNGIAPVRRMLDKGVNVCLGTDSAASNNTLNMIREMNILSLIHKAKDENAVAFSASNVLKTATINPAIALSSENEFGIIKEGACADLIFINLNSPSIFPNNNIISSLCYSANGSEIDSVMVNGVFLMRDGQFTNIDSEQVYFEVERIAKRLL